MKIHMLKDKLDRYLQGTARPAEVKQVEAWLSSRHTNEESISQEKKENLRQQILYDVQCHTAYPLFYPEKKDPLKSLRPFFGKFLSGLF